ncbi:hypothetical protein PENSPDRAFT_752200 [Peniophora sp. CONT]|nr:hypothetical protein PENSPDRAFT_752200 [Peniophora sp. CONT]
MSFFQRRSSGMEKVATMHELIDAIFAHLSRVENAVTALVCKQWLEISRDHIWYEVDRPSELFSLLAPLQIDDDHDEDEHEFVRIPKQADWSAFEPFSRRVRRLPLSVPPYHVSSRMTGALLRSAARPPVIFPNLRYLAWNVGGDKTLGWECLHLLFLHPRVRKLGLHALVPGNVSSEFGCLSDVATEVASLSPYLTSVEISTNTREVAGLDDPLLPIMSIASLVHVGLCQSLLTPFMLEILSLLPNLQTVLAIDPNSHQGHLQYDPVEETDFSRPLVLAHGAFGALRRIHLVMSTRSISALLDNSYFPAAQLSELRIRVLDAPLSNIMSVLISTISTRCSHLKTLVLNLYPPDFVERSVTELTLSPLTASILSPLCLLTELDALFIHHLMPVTLSNDELLDLMASLTSLTKLFLNPRPDYWPSSPYHPPASCFNWQTLILIAQRHPQMIRLGLYMDLTGPTPTTIPARFPALDILELGTSPCPSSRSARATLATGLCGILSGHTVLASGFLKNSTWMVNPPVYANAAFQADLERWTEARTLVHFGLALLAGTQRKDIYQDD